MFTPISSITYLFYVHSLNPQLRRPLRLYFMLTNSLCTRWSCPSASSIQPHKLGACVAISLCYAVRPTPCCVLRSPLSVLVAAFCFVFISLFLLYIEGGFAFSLACIFCGVPLALCYFVFVFLFFCLAPFYLSI